MEPINKGIRVSGKARASLGKDLKKKYTAGASIRVLAAEIGRSYGFVHGVLAQEGVSFRSRGGAQKKKAATPTA